MLMKIQVLHIELEIHFSLMQPLCQISKKLYRKSKPCKNLRTALRIKMKLSAILESTEIRNNNINIPLPLMIFIRMHSQESQFRNKCLICSIKSIICPNTSFLFAHLVHNPNSRHAGKSRRKFRRMVILQFVETCQTKYRINL